MVEVRFFKKKEKDILLNAIDTLWCKDHIYVRKPIVMEHLVLNTPWKNELAGEDEYAFMGMWMDGNIIGIQGLIPQEANVCGQILKSQTGTIWIVKKPKGTSVNGLLMEEYADNIRHPQCNVTLGFSERSGKIKRIMGDYICEDMPRWILMNRLEKTGRILSLESNIMPYLPTPRQCLCIDSLRVEFDSLDCDAWDTYYWEIVAPRTIGTCKDYKFLRWRYMESPVLKYHFITVKDVNGSYLGLSVIRIEKIIDGKYSIGRILEFISFDLDASVVLANAVVQFDTDVLMWDFYCLSDATAFGLETVGFRRLPDWNERIIVPSRYQPIDHSIVKLNVAIHLDEEFRRFVDPMSSHQWYITKGDADQDRAN